MRKRNRSAALERSVIDYLEGGGGGGGGEGYNMFYWINTLALSFCSGSKHLVGMNPVKISKSKIFSTVSIWLSVQLSSVSAHLVI